MPPDEHVPTDDPRAWLKIAREDLALSRARIPGVSFGLLCFHAQQAAEKAVKAVLIARSIPFPYVHDIGRLLDLVRRGGVEVPERLADADLLTDYGTMVRYPGYGEITESHYNQATALADEVIAWAEGITGATPPDED